MQILTSEFVSKTETTVTQLVEAKEKLPKPEKTGKKGKIPGQYVTAKDVVKSLGLDDNVFSVTCVNQVIKRMAGFKSVQGYGIMRG